MDYIRQFHREPVDWFCDSDTCAAIRQIEQEGCPSVARVRKTRDRKFTIVEAPEILAVHLKRSQVQHTNGAACEVKVCDDVPFLEELDLSDFTESSRPLKYRLYGVVGHRGRASAGHYVASVRRRDNGFVTISDSRMQQDEDGTWDELRNPSFDGQPFQPVLLFYLRLSSC